MDASALWESHWLVVVHACAAMTAIVLGAIQLLLRKGTNTHRQLGYVWVTLILMVCVSSFGIFEIRLLGPFSPIHLLSIIAVFTVWRSIGAARAGNFERHRKNMISLYVLALLLTGLFTLLPGRTMHQVVFG